MKYLVGILTVVVIIGLIGHILLLNPWWHSAIFYLLPNHDEQTMSERMYLLAHFRQGAPLLEGVFSTAEIKHLQDIDWVLLQTQIFWSYTLIIYSLLLLLYIPKLSFENLVNPLRQSIKYGLVVITSLLILAYLQFEPLFLVAHKIIFPNGNWAFDPEKDFLIQLYPPQFFLFFGTASLVIIMLILGLVVLFFWIFSPHNHSQRKL